jgi:hypothetical protein
VHCEERERLTKIYLAAIARNNEAASAMAQHFSEAWNDEWLGEMKDIRTACETALRELDRHRREHGC